MSRRKVAPLLLAASVFLTGATALVGSMTPAYAITSVEELRDTDSSHWAYQALADLVEKYDVIEGYPDYTFKGNRAATRYEMAAALNALIKAVGRDLARLGAEKANKSDLATLARLQEEFRNELAALNARTAALEARASAIAAKNSEQDTRLDLLEKTQLHGDFSFGILSTWANDGLGTALTPGEDGIQDTVGVLGRFRLGMKIPVVPGYDNSSIGEGDVIARLVGAFGRWSPLGSTDATSDPLAMPLSGYSAIAGAGSSGNEGFNTGNANGAVGLQTGLNLRQNMYVESAYYKQHFKPGIPIVTDLFPGVNVFPDNDNFRTSADLYVGIIPWRNLFNRSPYKGDELNQFQNTSLVNNPGLLANNIVPTIAMAWHQGLGEHLGADLTAAFSTFNNSDLFGGFYVTEELAFNYDTSFLGTNYTKPGSIYFGGYHIWFNNETALGAVTPYSTDTLTSRGGVLFTPGAFGNNDSTLNAFYTGWNQEWWRGIGTSVDWVMNNSGTNNTLMYSAQNGNGVRANLLRGGVRVTGVQQALTAALSVPLTVFNKDLTNRAKDVIGFGYAMIDPVDVFADGTTLRGGVVFDNTYEHVFEGYYRWAVNDSFSIIPSVQAIVNRFGVGENDTNWVLGLRTNFVF